MASLRTPGRPPGGGHLRSVPPPDETSPAEPPPTSADTTPTSRPESSTPWSATAGNSTPAAKSLTEAVDGGDYLEILIAQRRVLAELVDHGNGAVKIQALKQLSVVAAAIEEYEGGSPAGGGAPAAGSANSVVADTPDEPFDPYTT